MSQEMQNLETQNATAETADSGSIDAAAQAFQKRETPEPKPETATADDDSKAEPSDGEPAEDTDDAAELVEVEIGGKKFSVDADTAAEVQKATLRQSEFSRKMNEVSAKEKATTLKAEAAERFYEGAEKFAAAKAEVAMIERQLKQFESVKWQELRQENPAEYAAIAADLQHLRMGKADAEARLAGIDHDIAATRNQSLADKREEMVKTLAKDMKGWGDELGTAITKYAVESGYSVQEIQNVTDPKWVQAMNKARLYDAMQAGKTAIKAKAQNAAPVLKPGAPRTSDPKDDVMRRLRKSGSQDDAAAAFRSRMR